MKPETVRALAEAEVAGLSRRATAEKLQLSPRTISRYRHQAELREAVEQLRRRPRSELAQDVLVGLLGSKSEQTRLTAALGILRHGGEKIRPQPESNALPQVVVMSKSDEEKIRIEMQELEAAELGEIDD